QREARATLLVDGDDLAVEHAVRGLDRLRDLLCDVREALRQVVAGPTPQPHRALAHVGERAETVPFDLEEPALSLWHVVLERREHRRVLAARAGVLRGLVALAE